MGLDFFENNNYIFRLFDGILYISLESEEICCYKYVNDVLVFCCESKIVVLEDIEIFWICKMIVFWVIVYVEGLLKLVWNN